jgi:hypothetical protein
VFPAGFISNPAQEGLFPVGYGPVHDKQAGFLIDIARKQPDWIQGRQNADTEAKEETANLFVHQNVHESVHQAIHQAMHQASLSGCFPGSRNITGYSANVTAVP